MAKIMICDDAAFMRMSLKKIVEEGGHRVITEASTGIEAVENYKKFKPEIVLMDITMPELDGIQATKQIHEFDPLARIIMVSAMGHQDKVFDAIRSGAQDFIVKPFQHERILACIKKNFGDI